MTTIAPRNRQQPRHQFPAARRRLLHRLRKLDESVSWQDFFETYWKLIYRTATSAGLPDADAQEVVMETIRTVLRVLGRVQQSPHADPFKSRLLQITRWRILDHLQYRRTQKARPATGLAGLVGPDREPLASDAAAQINELWDMEWQQNRLDAARLRLKRRPRGA